MTDSAKDAKTYIAGNLPVAVPERISPLVKYENELAWLNKYLDQSDALTIHASPSCLALEGDDSFYSLPPDLHDSLEAVREACPLRIIARDCTPHRQLLMEVMLMQNLFNGLPGIFASIADLSSDTITKSILGMRRAYSQTDIVVLHTSTKCEACSGTIAVGAKGCCIPCDARHLCHVYCARQAIEPPAGFYRQCPVCRQAFTALKAGAKNQLASFREAP